MSIGVSAAAGEMSATTATATATAAVAATAAAAETETNIRGGLDIIQSMIAISADRLEGLRTQCATSAELTQQEIRSLETKLVRMFSELLLTKAKLPERLPKGLPVNGVELRQWLRVVGLSADSLNVVMQRSTTLEGLLDRSDVELRSLLSNNNNVREEETRRLVKAMNNLKMCLDSLSLGKKEPNDLFWDSWDRHHHAHHRSGASPRSHRFRLPSKAPPGNQLEAGSVFSPVEKSPPENIPTIKSTSPEECSVTSGGLTPSPSPPNSPSQALTSSRKLSKGFPTTPPPRKKHQTLLVGSQTTSPQSSQPSIADTLATPMIKSRSHESQLSGTNGQAPGVDQTTDGSTTATSSGPPTVSRSRLLTEPSPDSHDECDLLPGNGGSNNLTVPRSPCTPNVTRGMGHVIAHRFTKKFKVMSFCHLCKKQMFFGLKCKECKYRCHKDCASHVPPSCGLPPEFVDEFKKALQTDPTLYMPNTSPNLALDRVAQPTQQLANNSCLFGSMRRGDRGMLRINYTSQMHVGTVVGPDSSSAGSSCNSSSPSSPALLPMAPQTPAAPKYTQFNFPDIQQPKTNHFHHSQHVTMGGNGNSSGGVSVGSSLSVADRSLSGIMLETHPICVETSIAVPVSPRQSIVEQPTVVAGPELVDTNRSNESDKTASLSESTSASTDSDRTPVRLDSMEERDSGHWPRQNSLSLKEWDIPYDDLMLLDKIGKGRFGTVHRALWHGDVAVKLLKEDYLADERTLEAFKLEVATFKKTRHENVVLFMGACMKPPRLAIVTSLCKGNTLFTHIHLRKDKFNLNRTTMVAQQISQGMGYLHARGIVHKDLKTKNIFLENGKVIITDFGLFSATKLLYCNLGLGIPSGWLCYLAPELIRGLKPFRPADEDLPFSRASDVYAFGTVWYELLCGEFPFKSQTAEATIWQVGRGMKQTLANLQASRDVKAILMLCWSFQADDRPDFRKLLMLLERLPKKRLARSPSHPVQLSRSAESVF